MSTDKFDEAKCAGFLSKVMEHNAAAMTVLMASLGDRLGLFKALAAGGPATSAELAERASIQERHAREWLAGMDASGYLEHDADSDRYVLPREHGPVLAKDGHPFFLGAFHEQITGLYPMFEQVLQSFRTGDGIPMDQYGEHFSKGLDRTTHIWVERLLVPIWLAALPDVQTRLEQGADVAEVGCGSGLALIKLARTFPESRFVGYDLDPRNIERATAAAEEAGVSARVTFELRDLMEGVPGEHDLLACFDVLHDLPRPREALGAMHEALRPDGTLLLGEWAVEDDPDEDANPLATLMYGFSILYCVPTTIAQGGDPLGTLGLPEPAIRALADNAGFSSVKPLFSAHPIIGLYALRP